MARPTGVVHGVPMTGVVSEFDDPRGLGWVAGDDERHYLFHCTAVADSTRRIDAGTRVSFVVVPGHGGRYEARALVLLPGV